MISQVYYTNVLGIWLIISHHWFRLWLGAYMDQCWLRSISMVPYSITKSPFIIFYQSHFWICSSVRSFVPHSYLTGVTTANLVRYPQVWIPVSKGETVYWEFWKQQENIRGYIGLATPTLICPKFHCHWNLQKVFLPLLRNNIFFFII